jgi:hypothetical protein
MAKRYFVDPDQIYRDLTLLGRCYRPKYVCLVGGEPLLHPDLMGVIDAVRRSGVSRRIRVITNGTLLGQMSDSFWRSVDEVSISLYPGYERSAEEIKAFLKRAKANGVHLELLHIDRFCETYSELGTADEILINRIYSTCLIAHCWRCHTLYEGYFFLCPASALIPLILEARSDEDICRDGIRIVHSETFGEDLKDFLSKKEPLHACRFCLGSVGKRFAPVQKSRPISRDLHKTEDLIDWDHLEYLEKSHSMTEYIWAMKIGYLLKKALAFMPYSLQFTPAILRLKKVIRKTLPSMK